MPVDAASCPCCHKISRPRGEGVDALTCVVRHISEKAKGGCLLHARLHKELTARGSQKVVCCPADGCAMRFARQDLAELFNHIDASNDEAHAAIKEQAAEVYALHEPIDSAMKSTTLSLAAGPEGAEKGGARMLTLLQRPGTEVSSVSDIGTRLWDSSVALTRLLQRCCREARGDCEPSSSEPDVPAVGPLSASRVRGSRVCELGAGCGLVGMAFALHGAASVVLTDLPDVMTHLEANVSANFGAARDGGWMVPSPFDNDGDGDEGGGSSGEVGGCRVECRAYTWGTDPGAAGLCAHAKDDDAGTGFDYLVAADAIYLAEQIEPFLASLRALATAQTVIILALERRSPSVWQAFHDALCREFCTQAVSVGAVRAAVGEQGGRNVERLSILLCQRMGKPYLSV